MEREPPLPYAGFSRLRPGRIHMFCRGCGRKWSNWPRTKMEAPAFHPADPPRAVIVSTICEKCGHGGKETEETFRDACGRQLCGYCGSTACDKMGGRRRCDERLVNRAVAAQLKKRVEKDDDPKGRSEG